MRLILLCLFILPLQGCFFFFAVPGSMFQSGNACAGESAYVGQRLKHDDGRTGTVKEIVGRHQRCQVAHRPVLVQVEFDGEAQADNFQR